MADSGGVYNDFAASLQQETLREMADSFFGSRRLVEEELEQLHATLHELEAIAARALERLALLHALMLDDAAANSFYEHLDVSPGDVPLLLKGRPVRLGFPLPGGLRWSARYLRLFELAYTFAQDACTTYLHGRYRRDPVSGARGLTLHYHQIEEWCAAMNRRIAHLNKSQPPSTVLAYARNLRQDARQADAAGATLGGLARNVDENMGLRPLRCDEIGVGPLPALPSPARASEVVHSFARQLYADNGPRLRELIRELEEQRQQGLREIESRLN